MNRWFTRKEVMDRYGDSENQLEVIATRYGSSKLLDPECSHYCSVYTSYFEKLKDRPIRILEIGVKDGESLLMWRDYFHQDSEIVGLEFNPEQLEGYSHDRISVVIGDQSNIADLDTVAELGPFDIIIDDASHVMEHHQISFKHLFINALADDGVYLIEDLGTAYWEKWGGGLGRPESTIEFMKGLIDGLNYRFHKGGRTEYVGIPDASLVEPTFFDLHIVALHFHKGIVVVQKGYNPLDVL